jgi:hypothetical protein
MMFRVLGFLIGSATSIAIILLVTGVPDFHLQDPEIDQQRFDAAVEKLMARKQEVEQISQKVADEVAQVAEAVQDELATPQNEEVATTTLNNTAVDPKQTTAEENAGLQGSNFAFTAARDNVQDFADAQWYSFWNPFRSQIAADGFVAQLEKVTGLDYRVVKVKTGVYEVAFAYDDDEERRDKLSQISAATGLDLPDS